MPLASFDSLTSSRYEVRIAGGVCPGLRTDSLAMAIVGMLLEIGWAAMLQDRRVGAGGEERRLQ
jgi:hypothetical protein